MRRAVFFVAVGASALVVSAVAQQRARPGTGRQPEWPAPSITDYRPVSRLVVPQHPVPRAKFPTIDVHSHQPTPMSPTQLDVLISSMDALNLRVLVNLSGGSGDQLRQGIAAIRNSPYADRIRLFANVNFTGVPAARGVRGGVETGVPAARGVRGGVESGVAAGFGERAAQQLEADITAGAVGLKIYKDLGLKIRRADGTRLKLDDPELDPIWAMCGKLNVPVLIHTAEPPAFFDAIDDSNERWLEMALYSDRRYQDPKFPRFDELIAERDRMFAKHPNTRFIAAHFGYHAHDLARAAALLDRLPNVYLEVGAILAELGRQPRAAHDFFVKYQDRVLFGKDSYQPDEYPYYWRTFETADEYFDYYRDYHAFWKLYGMALPDVVLKRLYAQNALKIVPGLPKTGFTN